MNVYVLIGEECEDSVLLGVYSTMAKAEAAKAVYKADKTMTQWSYGIAIMIVPLDGSATSDIGDLEWTRRYRPELLENGQ